MDKPFMQNRRPEHDIRRNSPRTSRSPEIRDDEECRSRVSSITNRTRHVELSFMVRQAMNPLPDENVKVRGSTDSEDLSDPEPDFQTSIPPAVYLERANTQLAESRKHLQAGRYTEAETAQLKAIRYLDDREAKLGIPFRKRESMLEGLADVYVKREQYEPAKTILGNLVKPETGDSNCKWRYYYTIATIYLAQERLSEAEKFAKRAYLGRAKTLGKGHALISQSADLLFYVYEKQGDMQSAQVWRNLHPNENMMRDNPQVFKHVGTTRVAWNPDLSIDMNAPTKGGKTILINAIVSGDEDIVQQCIQRGANIERRCNEGINPLMYAVIHGQERIAGVLLSRGADPEATTLDWPPLHKACDQGDVSLIDTFLSYGADIESRAPKKFKLRELLARHTSRVSNDLDNSDFDSLDSEEYSSQPRSQPYSTQQGWTPLLRASARGQNDTITTLLDSSANLEARNPSGSTPLSCASESHNLPTLTLLLSHGASAKTCDKFRWTPLHRAQVRRSASAVFIVRALLGQGKADVNAKCEKGMSALHHAIERDNEHMVPLLLEWGADLVAGDVVGRTPLHTAIECRKENMVHLLLKHGADVGLRDASGRDALSAAKGCVRRSPEIVKLLEREKKRRKGSITSTTSMGEGDGDGRSGSLGNSSMVGAGGRRGSAGRSGSSSVRFKRSDSGSARRVGNLAVAGWMGRANAPEEPPNTTLGLQPKFLAEREGKLQKQAKPRVIEANLLGDVGGGKAEKKGPTLKSAVIAGSVGEQYRAEIPIGEGKDRSRRQVSKGAEGEANTEKVHDGDGGKENGHWWSRKGKKGR